MIYNKITAIAVIFMSALTLQSHANSIIAIVNDDVITWNTISSEIEPESTREEKLKLVNLQIDLALQIQKIAEIGLEPSNDTLERALINIAKQNSLTFIQLKSLSQYDEIVTKVSQNISINSLRDYALKGIEVSPTQSDIDIELLLNPSPKELTKQIRVSQIVLNSINSTESSLSDDELFNNLLSSILNDISNGSSFSDLAKLHSQVPSYKNGGLSDWFDYNSLPQIFKDVLDSLTINQISDPFKTDKDWRILKISDERSIDPHLTKIFNDLTKRNTDKYFNNWVKNLREDAYIDILEDKL
jgi:peptidyl-prolyl cis-trans isomerase SurA